jgi:hypothetical protein
MLTVILTLDYEIHGNGEGSPCTLMVEPTQRLMRQLEAYGAKLTIMAEVGEILRFRQHQEEQGRDDFHYQQVAGQLRDAVRRGHDVQLHLHPSYFNARYRGRCWAQDWSEYDLAALPFERVDQLVGRGKRYLEALLQPVDPRYRCDVFRAANWSVCPSTDLARALISNGIRIDTSVFKHGRRRGRVQFDYEHAPSALIPWRASENDLSVASDTGRLWEFPIYAEARFVGAFLSVQRLYRAGIGSLHRFPAGGVKAADNGTGRRSYAWLWQRHAWKADFNQCSGRQLVAALERAERRYGDDDARLPFVMIGHSKLFSRVNTWTLRRFLAHVAARPARFEFGTFADFPKAGANVRLLGARGAAA